MSRPIPSSKVVLVHDPRPVSAEASGVPVRRYRLARLRFQAPAEDPAGRFEHLKRVYD